MTDGRARRRVRARPGATRGSSPASTRRRGWTAGRAALRRFREEQLQPGAVDPGVRRARVHVQPRRRPDPRPLGPGRHRAGGRRPETASHGVAGPPVSRGSAGRRTGRVASRRRGARPCRSARERVTITDYKSSDVRDPARARQRARESLQLQIYAMGYEALTGRLPDAVQLHFLESGLVGRAEVDAKRLGQGRGNGSRDAAAGHPGRATSRPPGPLGLQLLPVPRDLPVERRSGDERRRRPGDPRRSRSTSATRSSRWTATALRRVVERTARAASSSGAVRSTGRGVPRRLGGGARAAVREEVPAVPRGRPRPARRSGSSRGSAG